MTPQDYTIPANWITLRHAAFVGPKNGQIDVVLALDTKDEQHYLLQVADGKYACIRSGQSALDNFANIVAKAPGIKEFSTFPWMGQPA